MDCRIEALAEDALLLRLGERVDAALNARVHALAKRLRSRLPGVEIVPAYASLLIRYDVLAWSDDWTTVADGETGLLARPARLRARIEAVLAEPPDSVACGRLLSVPVLYDEANGPDLAALAAHAGLTLDEVIARHTAPEYRVAMIGFAPGFPYLLGLDPLLAMPRRASPRRAVPAGSVAIGGAQTGIYPVALPGGWQLIGRTPLALFDPRREPPCLLAAGDRVRFRAIDQQRFAALAASGGQGWPLGEGCDPGTSP